MIELLVVIAAIAILASLLVPALVKAKSSARFTTCKANLRQQIIALQLYVNDHGFYPPWQDSVRNPAFSAPSDHNGTPWFRFLEHHIEGRNLDHTNYLVSKLYFCPSDRIWGPPVINYGYNAFGAHWWGDVQLGLGGIEFGARGQVGTCTLRATPESDVRSPSNMLAIGDFFAGRKDGGIRISNGFTISRNRPPAASGPQTGGRHFVRDWHDNRMGAAFCDGHVEGPKLDRILIDTNDTALTRWNKDNEPHREILTKY